MRTRRVFSAAGLALLVTASAACGSSPHPSSTPVTVFKMSADPGVDLPPVDPRHRVVLTSAALRASLDALLSRHATLVATLMHEVGAGDSDTGPAVNALAANTRSLTDAIAVVYGADGARAFAQLWEQHTQFFIDYANADRTHDGGAKKQAEGRLLDYQNDFASFVTTATAGGVPLVAVTNLLHSHVGDLTDYIDADVAGRTADARRFLDQAVAHMHLIAGAIAHAIVLQHLQTITP